MVKKTDLKGVLEFLCVNLADDESELVIKEVKGDTSTVFEVKIPKTEAGKLIGKSGRTADAIRTILYCIAAREKRRCTLQINE